MLKHRAKIKTVKLAKTLKALKKVKIIKNHNITETVFLQRG